MNTKPLFISLLVVVLLSGCVPDAPVAAPQPAGIDSAPDATGTPVIIVPPGTLTSGLPADAPASTGEPVPADTPVPTTTPSELVQTQVSMLVQTADHTFHPIDFMLPLASSYTPALSGLNPRGGVIGGTAFVYDHTTFPTVLAVDETERIQQEFIQNPTYGLAVWQDAQGAQSRLAWGTQLIVPHTPSSLQISSPDGSQLEVLYTQEASIPAVQLVAQFWSEDGKSLYFSREPSGMGGYIVFTGASSLYRIDIDTRQISELIPVNFPSGPSSCLDAISSNHRYIADHCSQNLITVRDLSSGAVTTVQPPDGLTGYRVLGSARFSPNGSRLAYALAASNPDAEQGWIAISDSNQGSSKLILTASPGVYYNVVSWLDDQTLLIQSNPVPGCEGCDHQLWTLNSDGSNLVQVAEGSFVTLLDKR